MFNSPNQLVMHVTESSHKLLLFLAYLVPEERRGMESRFSEKSDVLGAVSLWVRGVFDLDCLAGVVAV